MSDIERARAIATTVMQGMGDMLPIGSHTHMVASKAALAAIAAERERASKAICIWCFKDWPVNDYGQHYAPGDKSKMMFTHRCDASAIRTPSDSFAESAKDAGGGEV